MNDITNLSTDKLYCLHCESPKIIGLDILSNSTICKDCKVILDGFGLDDSNLIYDFPPDRFDDSYISYVKNFWPMLHPLIKVILIENMVIWIDDSFTLLQQLWDIFLQEDKYNLISADLRINHSSLTTLSGDLSFGYNEEEEIDMNKYLITHLFFSSLKLKTIPKSIGLCKHLRKIYLDSNEIEDIPNHISHLPHLEMIDLTENKLKTIPDAIMSTNMKSIILSKNQFTSIPDVIFKLPGLTFVKLNNNQINELPKDILDLKHLVYLDIRNNQIQNLPKLSKLTNLEVFLVSGNLIVRKNLIPIISKIPKLFHTDCLLTFQELDKIYSDINSWKSKIFIIDTKRERALTLEYKVREQLNLLNDTDLTSYWDQTYRSDLDEEEIGLMFFEKYNDQLLNPDEEEFTFNFHLDENLKSKLKIGSQSSGF